MDLGWWQKGKVKARSRILVWLVSMCSLQSSCWGGMGVIRVTRWQHPCIESDQLGRCNSSRILLQSLIITMMFLNISREDRTMETLRQLLSSRKNLKKHILKKHLRVPRHIRIQQYVVVVRLGCHTFSQTRQLDLLLEWWKCRICWR